MNKQFSVYIGIAILFSSFNHITADKNSDLIKGIIK